MSFSSDVREECRAQMSAKRQCQLSELTAILSMCGGVAISAQDQVSIRIRTENTFAAGKFCALVKKMYKIRCEVSVQIRRGKRSEGRRTAGGESVFVLIRDHQDASRVLADLCIDREGNRPEGTEEKRAYLRGAFLTAGSISDPRRFYHFEIACSQEERAELLRELIAGFGLEPRIVKRRRHFVVYLKEADQIADLLGLMEAPRALMAFENIRILREISGSVNRQVNCETANLKKTVSAAVKQAEDIRLIQAHGGLGQLPKHLREMAALRLEYPDMALKDLGERLDPPLGKSGVNHRLKALGEIAQKLREESPEQPSGQE